MPKIILPPCWFWPGASACMRTGPEPELCGHLRNQGACEHYNPEGGLGDLYRAVQEAGGIPTVIFDPEEAEEHDYEATIHFPEENIWARGDTYELAAVAAITKANEEAESDGRTR